MFVGKACHRDSLHLIVQKPRIGEVMKKIICGVMATFSLMTAAHAQSLCVFDLSGAGGDIYSTMQDYAVVAKSWDVDFKLKAYTDEALVVKDLKSGKCDAAAISGIRAREFNNFTGSIDAVGGITDNLSAKIALTLMSNPKLAPDMVKGDYEVAGVTTVGTLYLMVKDRSINTIQKMAGKTLGILEYDKADYILIEKIGAIPVGMDLAGFGTQFNSKKIDIAPLLPLMFKPFELYKGLGTQGAIVRFPILLFTGDIIIRQDKFPEGYGQKSRTWFSTQIDQQLTTSKRLEAGIPVKYWIDIPEADKLAYTKIIREARLSLTHQKILDKKMMGILKRVRCRVDPTNYECKTNDE